MRYTINQLGSIICIWFVWLLANWGKKGVALSWSWSSSERGTWINLYLHCIFISNGRATTWKITHPNGEPPRSLLGIIFKPLVIKTGIWNIIGRELCAPYGPDWELGWAERQKQEEEEEGEEERGPTRSIGSVTWEIFHFPSAPDSWNFMLYVSRLTRAVLFI